MIYVITYATHSEGNFENLINNKWNIHITVLGWGHKWNGFMTKISEYQKFISKLDDNDIVIVVDGFDVYIKNDLSVAIDYFRECNCEILFSKNVPIGPSFITDQIFPPTKGMTLNSGMFMGYVRSIKKLLTTSLKMKCKDDQRNFIIIIKKELIKNVKIDTNCIVFKNVKSKECIDLSDSVFVSNPGLHSYKRMFKTIIDYGQFFIREYIIISIIFVLLFCKSTKMIMIYILFTCNLLKNLDFSCV
jgi:hypothetical protein